jgi:hypothetical protein
MSVRDDQTQLVTIRLPTDNGSVKRSDDTYMPAPDEIDRDRIRSPSVEDDDADYELEPPDPEVIAAEERRAREAVEATRMTIDIDEIYRESDRRPGGEILDDWARNFRIGFRFQVKHLLIATAVVAIALALWRLELFGTALVLGLMLSVGGIYLYVLWQEKKQQQEAERRRREMYERNRAYHERLNRAPGRSGTADESTLDLEVAESIEVDRQPPGRPSFRFKFSLWELFVAMTVAAVVLGLVSILGGPANTATMLGFLALIGLVVHAIGFEPPEIVVLGWWLILVLYVLLSIVAVVRDGLA